MRLLQEIKKALAQSCAANFSGNDFSSDEFKLEKPPAMEMGEFAVACFPFARKCRKNPAQIASAIAAGFPETPGVLAINAAGPYLNIKLDQGRFIRELCENIRQDGQQYGRGELGKGQKVMIEYSSPNTNKPLHIGHIRNNLIGMALANIYQFCGFEVIKANLINDRGIHICKSMLAYQKWGDNATPKTSGEKGDHFVGRFYVAFENALKTEREQYAAQRGIDLENFAREHLKAIKQQIAECQDKEQKKCLKKQLAAANAQAENFEQEFLQQSQYYQEAMDLLRRWEEGDPQVRELWQRMNDWVIAGFGETYRVLGCQFDKIYRESETYTLGRQHVEKGRDQDIFYQKEDGSIWVAAAKLQQTAPAAFKGIALKDKLLLRGDGTSVYITQDIGTAILKMTDFDLDQSLYVVASEQNLHFKILFALLRLSGYHWAEHCRHVAYGMVTLPKGMGKIKSREGTAVDADDLVAEMTARAREKMQEQELRVPEAQVEDTALAIALAALKVFVLQVSLEKDIQFDPGKTIEFSGDTGPAIQYSYARIRSLFRKAQAKGITWPDSAPIAYELLTAPEEFALARLLYEFPETVVSTCQTHNIGLLVAYLLNLTKLYASNYTRHPVLKAESQELCSARLALAKVTAQVIHNGMLLLGASVPEWM